MLKQFGFKNGYYFFLLLFAFTISASQLTRAQTNSRAIIAGDFADPSVIKSNKRYYAVGTSSEWAPHFPIYTSIDLRDWKQVGHVFDKAPEWTSGSFWAPEYYQINKTYFIYYTARRKSDNISCIGVATSAYPDHGFKDHGVIIAYGKEAIDPFIFNDNGQLYITFKAYGLDKRPIELLASKLSPDGLKADTAVVSLLKDDKGIGMEGQSILKHANYYYLFYSAGNCCGDDCSYHVKLARATNFAGPYEKYEAGEILKPAPGFKCNGHGTFVQTSSGEYYYVSHAYSERSVSNTGREGMLSKLTWPKDNGWPSMQAIAGKHPLPDVHDDFTTNTPAIYWQYDFHSYIPVVKQKNGNLILSGKMLDESKAGVFYGVRVVSDDFSITTTVINNNNALKGLSFYGSAKAALGIGVTGNTVKFWIAKENDLTIIDSATLDAKLPVELKLTMMPDKTCQGYYKQANGNWKEIAAGKNISVNFLPQWDRAQRVGLFFKGTQSEHAEFSRFDMENKKQ